jgi:hypothetical protein
LYPGVSSPILVDGLAAAWSGRERWWKRHSYVSAIIKVMRYFRGAVDGVGMTNATKLSREAGIMEARRVGNEGTGPIDSRIETFGMVVVLSLNRDHVW